MWLFLPKKPSKDEIFFKDFESFFAAVIWNFDCRKVDLDFHLVLSLRTCRGNFRAHHMNKNFSN